MALLLLDARVVGLGSLSLEYRGLLRRLRLDGLACKFSSKLLLLRSLQDLRSKLARHAGILLLTLGKLRLLLVLLVVA